MPNNSFIYSIPYLGLTFILFVLFLCENKRLTLCSVKTSRKLSFYLILIFIGLRGHLNSDFISYYPFFESLPNIVRLDINNIILEGFEAGFVIYSSLIKTFFPNYFIWVFINTLIDLLVFRYVFRKYSYSEILPFIFFLAWVGLGIEFNLYRNAKSIILFLLSIQFLEKRKALPYFGLNILGMTFHTTSLIFLPLYFFLHRQYSKKILWICFILVNITYFSNLLSNIQWDETLFFLNNDRIVSKLSGYQDSGESYALSLGYFERTFIIITVLILYDKLLQQSSVNNIMINSLMVYYSLFLIFSDVKVFAERIPILFIFSYWILLSNIVYLYRLKLNYLIICFIILVSLKVIASNYNISCYYDNLLWGIKDYNERYKMVMKIL